MLGVLSSSLSLSLSTNTSTIYLQVKTSPYQIRPLGYRAINNSPSFQQVRRNCSRRQEEAGESNLHTCFLAGELIQAPRCPGRKGYLRLNQRTSATWIYPSWGFMQPLSAGIEAARCYNIPGIDIIHILHCLSSSVLLTGENITQHAQNTWITGRRATRHLHFGHICRCVEGERSCRLLPNPAAVLMHMPLPQRGGAWRPT